MGNIFYKCQEEDEKTHKPYTTTDSQIIYKVPISKKERKRRKYRFKKRVQKQYLIV